MKSNGFSLVELSIVLVILGLLVGGILSGQSLIRAAELRSISTDFAKYATALNTFRDKYFAVPGDMATATSFWGVAGGSGSDNTCYFTASTGTATCNGNGDGVIGTAGGSGYAELNRAWQHLANAGLIEGSYSGQDIAEVPGVHIPRSKISSAGYSLFVSIKGGNWGESFSTTSDNINIISFGTISMAASQVARNVAIKPEEAWNIDTKIDDSKPDTGKLTTDTLYSNTCFTGAYPTAAYALTVNSIACSFRYMTR